MPVLDEFAWFPSAGEEKQSIPRQEITQEALDEACPKCSKPLAIRLGKRGKFVGCTGYPECDYTRNLNEDRQPSKAPTVIEGRECPNARARWLSNKGRMGVHRLLGVPGSASTSSLLEKPKDTGVTCPECNKGSLIERKVVTAEMFYSCNTYPDCKYATWNPPIKGNPVQSVAGQS